MDTSAAVSSTDAYVVVANAQYQVPWNPLGSTILPSVNSMPGLLAHA